MLREWKPNRNILKEVLKDIPPWETDFKSYVRGKIRRSSDPKSKARSIRNFDLVL